MPEDNILDIVMAITLEGQSMGDLEKVQTILKDIVDLQDKIDIDLGDVSNVGSTIGSGLDQKLNELTESFEELLKPIVDDLEEIKGFDEDLNSITNMLRYIQVKFDTEFISGQSSTERRRMFAEIANDPDKFLERLKSREKGPGGRLDPVNISKLISDLLGETPDDLSDQMKDLMQIMSVRADELEKMGSPIAKFAYEKLGQIRDRGYITDIRDLYAKLFREEETVAKIFGISGTGGRVGKIDDGQLTGDIELNPKGMKGYRLATTDVEKFLEDRDVIDMPTNEQLERIAYGDEDDAKSLISELQLKGKYIPDVLMSKAFYKEYTAEGVAPDDLKQQLGTRRGDVIVRLTQDDIDLIAGKSKDEIEDIIRESFKISGEGAQTIAELLTRSEFEGEGGIARLEYKRVLTVDTFNTAMRELGDMQTNSMVVALQGELGQFTDAFKQLLPKGVSIAKLGKEGIVEAGEEEMALKIAGFVDKISQRGSTNEDLMDSISAFRGDLIPILEEIAKNTESEDIRLQLTTLIKNEK